MGRPRKNKDQETQLVQTSVNNSRDLRDSNGLIKGFQYEFDELGFINWRKHVKNEHIVLNRLSYASDGIDVSILTPDQIEKYKQEATEDKLLIKLAGFKDVARLRGVISAGPSNISWVNDKVICEYTINWLPNYETNNQSYSYSAVASASMDSVTRVYRPFLETIACNRAYGRCVRESLCIHIVGQEELDPNEKQDDIVPEGSPRSFLEKTCKDRNIQFPVLIKYLEGAGIEPDDGKQWNKFTDIPDRYCLTAIELIKKNDSGK